MTDFQEKKRILSIYNSGSTADPPIAIAIPYSGEWEDVINYESVSIIVNTNIAGQLIVQFKVACLDPNPIETTFIHTGGNKLYECQIDARYMKVSYIGNDGAAGTGIISTYLNTASIKDITGAGGGGSIINDKISGHFDLFGRLRVSGLETLIDIKHVRGLGINALNVSSYISGGGTQILDTNAPVVHMNVTTTGDQVIRQSRRFVHYQPGKSLLFYFTGRIITDITKNQVICRIGYFDDNDGVFFIWNNGTMGVGIRTSTSGSISETITPYSAWNFDKMDGSGPSGVTVDWSKSLIYTINMAWLGVGIVQFGVIYGGTFYQCHTLYNTALTSTYTATSNLPVRYSIQSTGGPGVMDMICMSASSEAGYSIRGSPFSIKTPELEIKDAGVEYFLLGIRLKNNYRTVITATYLNVLCLAAGNLEVNVYRYLETNPITGGTWNDAGTYTAMEYNTTGTWALGTPIKLYTCFISSNQLAVNLPLNNLDPIFITAGVRNNANFISDTLVITIKKADNEQSGRKIIGAFGWLETI